MFQQSIPPCQDDGGEQDYRRHREQLDAAAANPPDHLDEYGQPYAYPGSV
ncbi:hypothetical protein GCM10012275_61550 [Longimycelium tulufanense]|uniref:Uncharacterized protein n=2 Tax=Longimycelium tulufanense TaxID=907463 RepID=A0A8J3CEI2_9PSEU|nr:hypothetical protein GCM10012275_61550 [Longimycelium tulufanense]